MRVQRQLAEGMSGFVALFPRSTRHVLLRCYFLDIERDHHCQTVVILFVRVSVNDWTLRYDSRRNESGMIIILCSQAYHKLAYLRASRRGCVCLPLPLLASAQIVCTIIHYTILSLIFCGLGVVSRKLILFSNLSIYLFRPGYSACQL